MDGGDSLERIYKDLDKMPCDYLTRGLKRCADCAPCPKSCPAMTEGITCKETMMRDIVRRCKALAGVSE